MNKNVFSNLINKLFGRKAHQSENELNTREKSTFLTIRQKLQLGMRRKVPQIIQTEVSECGLACLAMVCGYYNMHVDLFNFRRNFGISTQGATLTQLINIASSIKLKTRAVSLDIHEVKELQTPCILHWDFNHFVVLVSHGKNNCVIHDPAFGRRLVSLDELSKHFTGVALEIWPGPEFVPVKQQSRVKLGKLMGSVHGLKSALVKIFSLSVVIEAINLLLPIGTQLVMDHVIIAEDHDLLAVICIGLVSFMLFRTFVSMLRAWISIVLGSLIDIQWKSGLFDHLLRLPLAYFEKRKLGDIQSRFQSLDVIRSTLTSSIVSGIIDSIMVVGVFIMMYLYGGSLVWVVLAFTATYITLRLATYNYYRQINEEQIVKGARVSSHFMETLYGVGTLKALGLSQTRARFWLNLNIDSTNTGIRLTKLDMLFGGANTFISTLDQIVILWLGASAVIDNNMTLGMFVAFNAYRGQFSDRAASLVNMALQLRMLSLHNDRISDIALSEPEPESEIRRIFKPDEPASCEIRNLYYQYDQLSKPVISNLSMKVGAGESIAIVGPSGVGKTTLMKIMAGLLQPTQGSVVINDLDIHAIGINNYRSCIACVLQEDKLFSGTISDNISSFDEEIDSDFVVECAKNSNIHDEIMRMSMGYETLLSELGGSLSGGQKQRILIARALYRRPNVIFLDEATSHLDIDNEAHINDAISRLKMTRIIIAHRPSTIASADRIFSLAQHAINVAASGVPPLASTPPTPPPNPGL